MIRAASWQRIRRSQQGRTAGRDTGGPFEPGVGALDAILGTVDCLARVDCELRFLYVSSASLVFLGYQREYLLALTLRDLVPDAESAALDALLARANQSGGVETARLTLLKSHTYPLTVELRVLRCRIDGADGYALAAFDVAQSCAREASLVHRLRHDTLTGLPNRHALDEALLEAEEQARAQNGYAVLMLVDLNDFRRINRALGYAGGDALLRETGQRLLRCLDPGMRAARVSSDKFALLFNSPSGVEALVVADRLARRAHDAIRPAYSYNAQPVNLTASIGIALYPEETAASGYAHSLLQRADRALTKASRLGNAQGVFIFDECDEDAADAARLRLEADMHDGIRNGEFELHFQPIVTTDACRVIGVEALTRWRHPTLDWISPTEFIPLAETTGLIDYLGHWVLKSACMQLVAWQKAGMHLQYVSVNVSPHQFRDPRFEQQVGDALALTGLEPGHLVLEITENVLMHDPEHAKSVLDKLTRLGIRFAIDDFGTGYSNLAYLQQLPLAKLKIDRSFVGPLPDSPRTRAIVAAVIDLAHTLGLDLVAEGVETETQRALLAEMGCDQIQGWLISRALPVHALAEQFSTGALQIHSDPQYMSTFNP